MVSTPKIIGLMSCGFLLCLGLSNPAPAAEGETGPHTRQPDGPRVGGQAGQPEAGSGCRGRKLAHLIRGSRWSEGGGQGGQPVLRLRHVGEKAGTPHTRQPDGPRVGGQGGQ